MHASELLSTSIQPLKPTDLVTKALEGMEDAKVSHLPVVAAGRLVGLVKDSSLIDITDPKAVVRGSMEQVEIPFVRDRQHIYDVLKLMVQRSLTVVPVLDMKGLYLGVVSEHDALRRMADIINVGEAGSIVVLEMNTNDYSLQQIARIVEDEGARLLSVYCGTVPDSTLMEVTLKINREDISSILRAFDRFEYVVQTTYQVSVVEADLRTRYEDVMRIIKM